MFARLAMWSVIGTLLVLLPGCTLSPTHHGNPPFQVLLNAEQTTPSTMFNPTVKSVGFYTPIQVYDETGKLLTLDAKQHPILFEAYWCPHCQRTLNLINENRTELSTTPYIVSAGFAPGTTLDQAKQLTKAELDTLHITGTKSFYLLSTKNNIGFPTMVFAKHNTVQLLSGEHTFAVWKEALQLGATETTLSHGRGA